MASSLCDIAPAAVTGEAILSGRGGMASSVCDIAPAAVTGEAI
jgi:hypothetical protein